MAYSVCPHHVSHYLGIDVHDTGKINRNIPLETGMVITIEPGMYFSLFQHQVIFVVIELRFCLQDCTSIWIAQ